METSSLLMHHDAREARVVKRHRVKDIEEQATLREVELRLRLETALNESASGRVRENSLKHQLQHEINERGIVSKQLNGANEDCIRLKVSRHEVVNTLVNIKIGSMLKRLKLIFVFKRLKAFYDM